MFTKHRSTAPTAKFYNNNEPPKVEELYSGYLHKSPALSGITKGLGKTWRRRFFVLYKKDENTYYLAYYRNNEKREKPLRKIDLSKVTLICTCPEEHQMWDWIQKNFKCLSASVLFLRVEDFMPKCAREYFLIGENSEEVGKWEKELLKAIRTLGNKVRVTYGSPQKDIRGRAISEPIPKSPPCDEGTRVIDPNTFRWSEPTFSSQTRPNRHYDIPKNYATTACKLDVCSDDDDDDDDDEDDTEETPEDISEYMDMASVHEVLQNHSEEEAFFQTNRPTATKAVESSQDLCSAAENQKNDSSMRRNSAELRCSMGSLSDFNGNCASTEINKSETQTPVEKEICVKLNDLSKTLIFTQEQGKLCVSECKKNETSHLFHKGDQILAFNDLLIDTVEEIQAYLKRLSKDEVKLTIRRYPGSQPFHAESLLTT
ncbi:pleckstrin homology domain-containing family S member 1-like isoform X1 [Triplophysa rosa]|uniref:pleckstrin homology domain-containing family S member 1-like isoform X1 n=1 Tax=Triplophysa rosa TaxID=992332 RepID=UPI002545F000|nr:pleckstrin homology domain-containing family S member 1-like isoform X1 [Triplophysa rosa]XP_057215402.1 pleckstrin homology domain-containing family S member 1-like isoform X1 [Triplophysa rosa]XP_057215403.1 pleckstrin homology domain-containing family S member 1-like isoform X1 [Triplophysa rosa]XP_057215404.1 pleckstrin homology domain-containing family S member 1-like isoform X1 [Triplophysa rosa]XP_057215406.1 pleckstrin homology domain-containing family S member 1-like isoform X1 [Tri